MSSKVEHDVGIVANNIFPIFREANEMNEILIVRKARIRQFDKINGICLVLDV